MTRKVTIERHNLRTKCYVVLVRLSRIGDRCHAVALILAPAAVPCRVNCHLSRPQSLSDAFWSSSERHQHGAVDSEEVEVVHTVKIQTSDLLVSLCFVAVSISLKRCSLPSFVA
jgi:hypothetical protein